MLHVITKSPFTSQGTTLTLDGGERSMFRLAGRHAGVIVAEVELPHEHTALDLPDWLGDEVTDDNRYSNFVLATIESGLAVAEHQVPPANQILPAASTPIRAAA